MFSLTRKLSFERLENRRLLSILCPACGAMMESAAEFARRHE